MTNPTLTPEGRMRWPVRDWLNSLCVPQADGRWLVQAPIWRDEEPLLYLLPNEAAKDRFLTRALGLVWLRIVIRHWLGSPLAWLLLVTAYLVRDMFGVLPYLRLSSFCFLVLGIAGIGYVLWQWRLFSWLGDVAVTPPPGWKRPDIVVRRAEEWAALQLSNGWRVERVLVCGAMLVTVPLAILAIAAYLNECRGVGLLDALVPDMAALPRAGGGPACRYDGWAALLYVGVLVMVAVVWRTWHRAERHRAVPLAG